VGQCDIHAKGDHGVEIGDQVEVGGVHE